MPEIGKVYNLGEADYRYGVGPLAVQVTRIIRRAEYAGEPWWEVECTAKNPSNVGPGAERFIYIRATALQA